MVIMEAKIKILIMAGVAIVLGLIAFFIIDEVIWQGHSERDMWPNPPALIK